MVQSSPTLLYVNPVAGNDRNSGSQTAPLKTIRRALELAVTGSRIQLAAGTYQATTGETFPLVLPAGVTLVGNESTKGNGIVILGGGQFTSPIFATQNTTLRLESNAQLRGVTVTNPERLGTGVWIESSSPIVVNCTLTNCKREGILATGTANPVVTDNVVLRNAASGFSIVRNAKGEWRRNVCRETGFGIAIGDSAAPLLTDNQVSDNRAGIVLNRSCRPVLRNNLVERSQEAGLVITEKAMPDLGRRQDPAGNIFRESVRWDIQNGTPGTVLSVGNQVNPMKVQGAIELGVSDLPLATLVLAPLAPTPTPSLTPTPTPTPTPTVPADGFADTRGHWAAGFIQGLVRQGYISGFPDGSFKPDAPLTRAQYAAMLARTFDLPLTRPATNFVDVSPTFWAYSAIAKANRMGFIAGYPDSSFRPDQNLTRVQAIVALVNGLGLSGGVLDVLSVYGDRSQIPNYAGDEVATATQRRIVVNHPDVHQLEPLRDISRAEVSALIYQALVALNRAPAIASTAIVQMDAPTTAFTDIQGHWAAEFIQRMASQNFVSGFADGSFQPDASISRAQYAAIVARAFNPGPRRTAIQFPDVPANHWARPAIDQAYRGGFISGFPDGTFQPDQNVLRLQVWLSLVSGLSLPVGDMALLSAYDDRGTIPQNAQDEVATATQSRLVVNYPNLRQLNPLRQATRAEVVATVYQALVQAGRMAAISSPYIVLGQP